MRADTHDGPEQICSTQRPDTLMQLSRSSLLEFCLATRGRAIHFGTKAKSTDVRSYVSFQGVCVAKLQDKPSPRNNRIMAHKFLNQHCALASALESILLILAPKIVLQHNRPKPIIRPDFCVRLSGQTH